MKNKAFYYSISIVILALSCNSTTKKADTVALKNVTTKVLDTIKPTGFKNNSVMCSGAINKYHKKFGIVISDYYIVLDSLTLDLNSDKRQDNILVLSPLSLESEDNPCKNDISPKRLLVEIINTDNGGKVRNIYPNLVSDTGGVLSRYNGISKKGNGFEIIHEAGAKYSWLYKTEFSVGKNQILLSKITKTCAVEGNGKTIAVPFNNFPAHKVNIPDTLKADCNCDKLWKALEN